MLSSLYIENLAVIEKASVDFFDGFTVFTGETGAGKSIVIDAINACLGQRATREIVRTGTKKASVSAAFCALSAEAKRLLTENGFVLEDETLVIDRDIYADGRSTAKINGKPATVSFLRELGVELINIHGQHDNQILLSPDRHLSIIDSYGGLEEDVLHYKTAFRELSRAIRAFRTAAAAEAEKESRLRKLGEIIEEIEKISPRPGEDTELEEQAKLFRSGEKIASAMQTASLSLFGDDDTPGAVDLVSDATGAMGSVSEFPVFAEIRSSLESLSLELKAVAESVQDQMQLLQYDPQRADEIEKRISRIRRLKMKYGPEIEDILRKKQEAEDEVQALSDLTEELARLNAEALRQKDIVTKMAADLTEKRRQAGEAFAAAIEDSARFLEMPDLTIAVAFASAKLSAQGDSTLEILLSANRGEPPKPISKIASGGELSRIMLAIKSVMAEKDGVGTLIFDEIDTGVSGRAAQKIGRKLKEVAKSHQVLCVTHSAQIAALGHHHLLIQKQTEGERTFTRVQEIESEARIEEVARIFSTDAVSDLMRQTAASMIEEGRLA